MTPSKFSLPRYEHFTAKPGFFLAQVVGESMNKRIPNGWANPRNSRFSQASPKGANPKSHHSVGRNVEMRHLTQFTGWSYVHGAVIAPEGVAAEREDLQAVVLKGGLAEPVRRLNPKLPESAVVVVHVVTEPELSSLVQSNWVA